MINLKKCKFSKAQIHDAKSLGIGVEMEHTKDRRKAYKIALQHECEFGGPLYYKSGLLPMERKLKKLQGGKHK
jgi:hypothetical protein